MYQPPADSSPDVPLGSTRPASAGNRVSFWLAWTLFAISFATLIFLALRYPAR